MADETGERVDYEVLAVFQSQLLVRYKFDGRHMDMFVTWDGVMDLDEKLRQNALGMIMHLKAPPVPTFDVLQQQVGKQGYTIIPLPAAG